MKAFKKTLGVLLSGIVILSAPGLAPYGVFAQQLAAPRIAGVAPVPGAGAIGGLGGIPQGISSNLTSSLIAGSIPSLNNPHLTIAPSIGVSAVGPAAASAPAAAPKSVLGAAIKEFAPLKETPPAGRRKAAAVANKVFDGRARGGNGISAGPVAAPESAGKEIPLSSGAEAPLWRASRGLKGARPSPGTQSGGRGIVEHVVPFAPAAYEAASWLKSRGKAHAADSEPGGVRKTLWETAETGMIGGGVMLLAGLLLNLPDNSWTIPAAMAVASWAASSAMTDQLGKLRQVVVGGWQASHDQKYRVGSNGQLRDVRGHKYGSDRYEAYANGPVGPAAKFWIRTAAAAAGLAWLFGAGWTEIAVFNGILTALYFLNDAYKASRPAKKEIVRDAESSAHAARFSSRK